jgi:hypothetical protein
MTTTDEKQGLNVEQLHDDSWQRVTDFLGSDLPLPYLYTTTRSEAYRDLCASIHDSGIDVPDTPLIHAVLYFCPSKLYYPGGKRGINLYHGGTLVPKERTELDTEEELMMGITRENVRNLLRSGALIYGLGMVSFEYNPFAATVIDRFDRLVSLGMAYQTIDDKDTFIRAMLKYKKAMESSAPAGLSEEEEHKIMTEELGRFLQGVEDYDPVTEWQKLFEEFAGLYLNRAQQDATVSFYNAFRNSRFIVQRRNAEGEWEVATPDKSLLRLGLNYQHIHHPR